MIALLLAASTFCNPMSISNATVEIISRDHPKGWRALDLEGGPAAAVDGRYRTWWTAEKLPAAAEYVFAGPRQLRAMRLIWRDLGLDTTRGVMPGAYRYRVEALVNAHWTTWIDASQNTTDLTVDYREGEPVKAEAVRLEVLAAPKGMTAAVTEFTVFAEPLVAAPPPAKPSHFAVENATREIRAWRGETVDFPLPAGAKLGIAPAGFAVRVGTLRKVEYRVPPSKPLRMKSYFGYGYDTAYDRVEWGVEAEGPKYAEIAVPADAKAGVYRIGDITLTVVDRVLPPPSEWKYYLDLWQHPWAVARWFGVKPFSKEHYAKMEPLWRQLAAAGQKVLTVTLIDQPWNHQCYDAYGPMIRRIHNRSGSVSFDYSLFDEYVAFGRKCGIGPDIACYTMCPWSELVSWEDADGKLQRKKVSVGSQEFRDYWSPFLSCFERHLREKGWLGHVAIAMDERSPEDMRKISSFIREQAPGLKITLAGNRKPSEFKGVSLDSYSQELNHTTPEFLAEVPARRAAGMTTTFYVCCGPWQPNTFLFSDPDDAYWLGYYPAAAGLDGFLRWAYNSWPEDPFKSAAFKLWSSGDTYFVYPNGDPSTRFLLLRKGIVAAEKCRVLKQQGLFADELRALAKKYDYKTAVKKENGDFAALVAETEALLNRK